MPLNTEDIFGPSEPLSFAEQRKAVMSGEEDEEFGVTDYVVDIGRGAVHGGLGFVESVIDLGADIGDFAIETFNDDLDFRFGDYTPDLNGGLTPKTVAGGITSGASQFLAGFGVGGTLLKGVGLAQKLNSFGKVGSAARAIVQGGVADFISFKEHEERLSNFLQEFPSLQNPVLEYLAADKDDGFLEGRLKNVLEGGGLGLATEAVFRGIKGIKNFRQAGEEVTEEAASRMLSESVQEALPRAAGGAAKVVSEAGEAGARATKDAVEEVVEEAASTPQQQLLERVSDQARQRAQAVAKVMQDTGKSFDEAVAEVGDLNVGPIPADMDAESLFKQFTDVTKETLNLPGDDAAGILRDKILLQRADDLGANAARVVNKVSQLYDNIGDAAAHVKAGNDLVASLHADLKHTAATLQKAAKEGGVTKQLEAELVLKSQRLQEAYALMLGVKRSLGRTFRALRFKGKDLKNVEILNEITSLNGGSKNIRQLADDILLARSEKGIVSRLNKGRFWDLVNEVRINALLTNPTTHVVNGVSNVVKSVLLPFEKAVGGLLTANPALVKEGFSTAVGLFHAFRDSARLSLRALRDGNSIVDSLGTIDASVGREALATDKGWVGNAFTFLAGSARGVANSPSRILGASDEFFKQINYRAFVYQRAAKEAASKFGHLRGAKKSKAIGEYIANRVQKSFDDLGRGVEDDAIAYARDATFTTPLTGFAGSIQRLANNHPALRLFVPFIRTPSNILRDVAKRTPLAGAFLKEVREDLLAGGARAQKVMGQWAVGTMLYGTALSYALEGKITGNGPADPAQRKLKFGTGWQPYSIVHEDENGKKSYIRYNRLDPFGMFLGLSADFAEVANSQDEDTQNDMASAMLAAFARNVNNRSYLMGLSDLFEAMSAPDKNAQRLVSSLVASTVPFNALQRQITRTFVDDEFREVRTVMDKVYSQTPGLSDKLDPKRNILGENVPIPVGFGTSTAANTLDFVNPFLATEESDDKLAHELASLNHGFRGQRPNILGVDLREIQLKNGRSAFDRLQELTGSVKLRGKTLRQSLEKLIANPRYQELPNISDGVSPTGRVEQINKILTRYKSAARRALRRKNKDIDEMLRLQTQKKLAGRQLADLRRFVGGGS